MAEKKSGLHWVDSGFCDVKIPVFFDSDALRERYGDAVSDEDFERVMGKALLMENGSAAEFPIFLLSTSVATILHEVVHTVTHIMGHFGIEDDEFRAYITQHLFTGVRRIVKKAKHG